jgi:uncharacterized protein YlzI (FlbEa/FlbD family)
MIRLLLVDGTAVHVNPDSIAYMQRLPDEKAQKQTKVVLLTGEPLHVRQAPDQILVAMGEKTKGKRK